MDREAAIDDRLTRAAAHVSAGTASFWLSSTAFTRACSPMVAQVESFRDRVADGKSSTPPKLMAFLKDWLTNHILQTDMRYSSHLGGRRAA